MENEADENSLPSDEIIKEAVFQWLKNIDASKVTKKDLKQQLESVHGWNLNAKKSLLSEALMEYFEKIANPDENLDDERKNEDPNVEENDEPEEEVEVDAETTSGGSKKRKKTRSGGFQTLVQLSTKLSEFFDGEIALRRPEVTQRIWKYIKENNLQNPKNRREILCDEKLELLFKKKKIDMFKMTKLLSENMKSVAELQSGLGGSEDDGGGDDDEEGEEGEEGDGSNEESKKMKKRRITKLEQQVNGRQQQRKEQKEKEKKQKKSEKKSRLKDEKDDKPKRTTALSRPVELSSKLSEFLGYHVVPRTQVTKLMWNYIKEKNLQDPSNKRNILCDEKMENLFEKKQFTMFEMTKYLNEMMTATSLPSDYVAEEES